MMVFLSLTLGRRIVVFVPPKRFTGWMSKSARLMVCIRKGGISGQLRRRASPCATDALALGAGVELWQRTVPREAEGVCHTAIPRLSPRQA